MYVWRGKGSICDSSTIDSALNTSMPFLRMTGFFLQKEEEIDF